MENPRFATCLKITEMALRMLLCVYAVFGLATAHPLPSGSCRCRAPQPCFQQVPFGALNTSVHGRLIHVPDEMQGCLRNLSTEECGTELAAADKQFFYTGQPGGYMHTGLANVWNISHGLAAFAVAAESEADIQAAVLFANRYNLRLTVKGTG